MVLSSTKPDQALRLRIIERIADIDAAAWNALGAAPYPFRSNVRKLLGLPATETEPRVLRRRYLAPPRRPPAPPRARRGAGADSP